MGKNIKLVFDWGVNDVNYVTEKRQCVIQPCGKELQKLVWRCHYYADWKDMLRRAYDHKYHMTRPTYENCKICEEWRYFSNFIKWVDSQPNKDWRNCSLDKDLLGNGKLYSPDTCVYLPSYLNSFISIKSKKGTCLTGVHYIGSSLQTKLKPYRALCRDPFNLRKPHVGYYSTELEAHKAWQAKKHEYAWLLAEQQQDSRVAKALRERYAPDKDLTGSN